MASEKATLHLPAKATALHLITVLYKYPSLQIEQSSENTPKLVLESGEEITGENTISEYLSNTVDKFDSTPESRAEVREWLSRSSKFATSPEDVYAFDCWMASRCFAVQIGRPTWVDFFLYARLHPVVKTWTKEETWQHPAIFRFFDYIQNRDEVQKLSAHDRGDLQHVALSDIMSIPDEYKLPRNERPINCLPVVARSAANVDTLTKSLAATSINAASAEKPSTEKKSAPSQAREPPLDPIAAKKAKKKAEKKEQKPKQEKKSEEAPNPGMIDLRVGLIRKAEKHPDADSLYVSQIDVGEENVRIVCSGLVKYIPLEEMQNRYVVCVCNLKEVKMRGVMSQAMVLAASESVEGDAEKEKVELVIPPPGATPGTKVYVSGFGDTTPESVLPPKKKIFETVQPGFTTLPDLNVAWKRPDEEGAPHLGLVAKVDGVEISCKVKSIVGATVR